MTAAGCDHLFANDPEGTVVRMPSTDVQHVRDFAISHVISGGQYFRTDYLDFLVDAVYFVAFPSCCVCVGLARPEYTEQYKAFD